MEVEQIEDAMNVNLAPVPKSFVYSKPKPDHLASDMLNSRRSFCSFQVRPLDILELRVSPYKVLQPSFSKRLIVATSLDNLGSEISNLLVRWREAQFI